MSKLKLFQWPFTLGFDKRTGYGKKTESLHKKANARIKDAHDCYQSVGKSLNGGLASIKELKELKAKLDKLISLFVSAEDTIFELESHLKKMGDSRDYATSQRKDVEDCQKEAEALRASIEKHIASDKTDNIAKDHIELVKYINTVAEHFVKRTSEGNNIITELNKILVWQKKIIRENGGKVADELKETMAGMTNLKKNRLLPYIDMCDREGDRLSKMIADKRADFRKKYLDGTVSGKLAKSDADAMKKAYIRYEEALAGLEKQSGSVEEKKVLIDIAIDEAKDAMQQSNGGREDTDLLKRIKRATESLEKSMTVVMDAYGMFANSQKLEKTIKSYAEHERNEHYLKKRLDAIKAWEKSSECNDLKTKLLEVRELTRHFRVGRIADSAEMKKAKKVLDDVLAQFTKLQKGYKDNIKWIEAYFKGALVYSVVEE